MIEERLNKKLDQCGLKLKRKRRRTRQEGGGRIYVPVKRARLLDK